MKKPKKKIKTIISHYRTDVLESGINGFDKDIKKSIRSAREVKDKIKSLPRIE